MIAKIYPVRRLPAFAGPFDYICSTHEKPGDLVEIKFKGFAMPGVIWAIHKTSDITRIDTIGRVIEKQALSQKDLDRLDAIALLLAQSPASLLQLFPFISSRKIAKRFVQTRAPFTYHPDDITRARAQKSEPIIADSLGTWPLHVLNRIQTKGQHLILCPNDDIASFMHQELGRKIPCTLITGASNVYDQQSACRTWKKGDTRVLIGTRTVSLWPAHKLTSVTIIDTENPDYSFLPRNPRLDTRFAGHLLAKQHGAVQYYIGHTRALSQITQPEQWPTTTLLDLNKHPSPHPYLSTPVLEAIEQAFEQKKRVLLFLNKKGVATHFQCRSCGALPTCGNCGALPLVREKDLICPACKTEMWHPTHCPTCNKKTLSKKGIGIDHVKDTLQELFPTKVHASAEKMGKIPTQFDTLLVSEQGLRSYELSQVPKVDLMIDLCADYHFLDESYACDEKGRYKLIRLLHLAKDLHAHSIVQSYQEPRIRGILGKNWYKEELTIRKEHECPPYGTELRIEAKMGISETLRIIDKNELLTYLTTFRSKAGKDTITVVPQIESYERLTSPK